MTNDYASSCHREVVLTERAMAQVDWYIEGVEFTNCNCDYACPCQFESRRPHTETVGASRPFGSIRVTSETWRSMASAPRCSTPGRDQSTRATASVRPSSMSGRTASNETLLLPCSMVARPTKGRPTGGSIARCRAPCIPRFSSASSLTWISSAEKHASCSPGARVHRPSNPKPCDRGGASRPHRSPKGIE